MPIFLSDISIKDGSMVPGLTYKLASTMSLPKLTTAGVGGAYSFNGIMRSPTRLLSRRCSKAGPQRCRHGQTTWLSNRHHPSTASRPPDPHCRFARGWSLPVSEWLRRNADPGGVARECRINCNLSLRSNEEALGLSLDFFHLNRESKATSCQFTGTY